MAINNPTGWLPYGSTDSSVILQHPLTSDPTAYLTSKCSSLITYGTPSNPALYDSVNGFSPSGSNGFRLFVVTGSTLCDWEGQMTFEVSREWLCKNDLAVGSHGYTPASREFAISGAVSAGTNNYWCTKDVTGSMTMQGFGTSGGLAIHSAGKDDFVRVNVGWFGGKLGGTVVTAFDGLNELILTKNSLATLEVLRNLYIGTNGGTAGTFMAAPYSVRNLQISTRPPMFPVHQNLHGIAILSDSLCTSDVITGANYDSVTSWSMRKRIIEHGFYPGSINVSVNPGWLLDNSVPGSYLKDSLPALLANNPTVFVMRGGSNDCPTGRPTESSWQASVTDYITDAFANTYVRLIVLADVPTLKYGYGSSTDPYAAHRVAANSKLRAAANAWRAANPTDPRQIVVVDCYSRLGGETAPSETFLGQISGSNDNLHFAGAGHYLHGTAIADGIMQGIRQLNV